MNVSITVKDGSIRQYIGVSALEETPHSMWIKFKSGRELLLHKNSSESFLDVLVTERSKV